MHGSEYCWIESLKRCCCFLEVFFFMYSANTKLCCLSKGFVEIDETEAVERMQTLILIENQG